MTTVFQRVGPYEILSQIGAGGMGLVFLAEDTRNGRQVALKLVTARDPDIVDAERRGVLLQERLSQECSLVPKVYEHGDLPSNHFFIAMEYVEGENLSDLIARGPTAPERAADIVRQMCEFLAVAHSVDEHTESGQSEALVHGDLKPRNVRVTPTGEIRILDFGIAKALSLSRKVTRNDFGSLPYMSPERLDAPDPHVDRSVDLWALGVILYELLSGEAPFKAADTRRLEQQIRSGIPRKPLAAEVPLGLRAITARLLAPRVEARYESARRVLEDLQRFIAGETTTAEGAGFPHPVDDQATRRTVREEPDEATRRTDRPSAAAPHPPAPASAGPAARPKSRITLRGVLLVAAVFIVLNEFSVLSATRRPAVAAMTADAEGMSALWDQHARLAGRSLLRIGVQRFERALRLRAVELSDQVIANYRGPVPTVRERQWLTAQKNLRHALALAPGDRRIRAALRYCDGHLERIDGEAEKSRGRRASANRHFADAVIAFREAAELRREWPDPFLGLARTFIYGLEDIDRAADAIKQAQQRGYTIGDREIAQLGDGYRGRGEKLRQTARQLRRLPQEEEYLQRALAAYREALGQYEQIPGFAGIAVNLQRVHRAIDEINERLEQLEIEKQTD